MKEGLKKFLVANTVKVQLDSFHPESLNSF